MLDAKYVREHPEEVQAMLNRRGLSASLRGFLEAEEARLSALREVEELRAKRNEISSAIAKEHGPARAAKIEEGRQGKEALDRAEHRLAELEGHASSLLLELPNMIQDDVPDGAGEEDNAVVREEGRPRTFPFPPRDHAEIGEALDIIDIKRAAKVSGSRFGYLKGDAALLEFALVRLAMNVAVERGFIPVVPPVLIRADMMKSMGYVDTPEDLAERYYLQDSGLFLVGTAEQSVVPMHAEECFEGKDLPRRYVAFSSCFREEAGSYGKDTRGILRVHQFDKVELVSFAAPSRSREEHMLLLEIEEELWKKLEVPYRVVQLCAGDLSRPSAATIDIEAWLPGQGAYREVSSTSNTTDYQARRLDVRVRTEEGTELAHILNGTGFAIGRAIIAILENHQREDGTVALPAALASLMGTDTIGGTA